MFTAEQFEKLPMVMDDSIRLAILVSSEFAPDVAVSLRLVESFPWGTLPPDAQMQKLAKCVFQENGSFLFADARFPIEVEGEHGWDFDGQKRRVLREGEPVLIHVKTNDGYHHFLMILTPSEIFPEGKIVYMVHDIPTSESLAARAKAEVEAWVRWEGILSHVPEMTELLQDLNDDALYGRATEFAEARVPDVGVATGLVRKLLTMVLIRDEKFRQIAEKMKVSEGMVDPFSLDATVKTWTFMIRGAWLGETGLSADEVAVYEEFVREQLVDALEYWNERMIAAVMTGAAIPVELRDYREALERISFVLHRPKDVLNYQPIYSSGFGEEFQEALTVADHEMVMFGMGYFGGKKDEALGDFVPTKDDEPWWKHSDPEFAARWKF